MREYTDIDLRIEAIRLVIEMNPQDVSKRASDVILEAEKIFKYLKAQ